MRNIYNTIISIIDIIIRFLNIITLYIYIYIGANHKTNGVDGGGITKENICQCAHLSYKQYKCQQ